MRFAESRFIGLKQVEQRGIGLGPMKTRTAERDGRRPTGRLAVGKRAALFRRGRTAVALLIQPVVTAKLEVRTWLFRGRLLNEIRA